MLNMTSITYDNASYGRGERQALEWLAQRGKWLRVKVSRRSDRPFDLNIEGTYDSDSGYDYDMSNVVREKTPYGERVTGMRRVKRDYPKVMPANFSAWFVLAALHEFWAMGLIAAPYGDWSFIRDREPEVNWRVLENIYAKQAMKRAMVPMFSQPFISAVWYVWGLIAPDAEVENNEEAIELVLDADRLTTNVGKWADEEFDAAQAQHGYEKAAAELARLVKLV